MQTPLLSASGLTLGYGDQPVVENVSFALKRGEVLSVVGHNGSGKSTLIKTLLGILPPLEGKIVWQQNQPDTIAFLGQRTEFDTRFPIRVRDLAAMGSWPKLGFLGHIDKECETRIEAALERTGILDIADMALHTLSAGQLQRALFARTIVQDAPLILLDEPFTAVDQTTEEELLTLIKDWSSQERTVILILHDLSAVLEHSHAALLLGAGKALFGNPNSILTPENLVEFDYISNSQAHWLEAMHTKKQARNV